MPYQSAGPRTRKLQVMISPTLEDRVRERADREGDTMSEVVRRLLSIYAAEGDRSLIGELADRLQAVEGRLAEREEVSA